jgi:hypothetical protein
VKALRPDVTRGCVRQDSEPLMRGRCLSKFAC